MVDLGAFVQLTSLLKSGFDGLGERLGHDDTESVCLWWWSHDRRPFGTCQPSYHPFWMARDDETLAITLAWTAAGHLLVLLRDAKHI